jgi:hypothetical protein
VVLDRTNLVVLVVCLVAQLLPCNAVDEVRHFK